LLRIDRLVRLYGGVPLAVAIGVEHQRGPALRLRGVPGLVEHLGIEPATTGPQPLVHYLSSSSKPNCRWCVSKEVSTKVYFIVVGSSIASCQWLSFSGKSLAEGWSEPSWQAYF
jgi:hypothetical protein